MARERESKPYGEWPSPVSAALLAGDKRLRDLAWDAETDSLVWLEGRGDRGVLVVQAPGEDAPRELTQEIDVRGEVGYGGGDFAAQGGRVFFAERRTGRLWVQSLSGGEPRPITPAFGRAAAPAISDDGRWVVFVHHDPDSGVDRLAVVDSEGRLWPQILHQGADFYLQPRWAPGSDPSYLLFLAWDHPQMPWEGAALHHALVDLPADGLPRIQTPERIAGGPGSSVFQPQPGVDGETVYYVSDESGRWHLWRLDLASGERRQLTRGEAEYGLPAWVQGMRTYGLSGDGQRAICCRNEAGFARLTEVDLDSGEERTLPGLEDYGSLEQPAVHANDGRVACIASGPTTPPRVVVLAPATDSASVISRASAESVSATDLATCEAVSWASANGEDVHGLLYRPHNAHFAAEGAPPLIVFVHGGPTDQVRASWDPRSQFFATRGFAVLWPNYRGSTGYGRRYWESLREGWGVVDVEDVVAGARALAARGEVDAARMVIAGGSAGGYTVLQTLIREPTVFAAGLCYYGVADLFALARDTHKFEQYYTDSLVGRLPEEEERYRERSPVFHADRIERPVAVFQGSVDRVVPPAQSDAIVAALRDNGIPCEYHLYEGEGHGFRKPETLAHFYAAMEAFLLQHVIHA